MSMTSFVHGYRPPNDKWKEMKSIYDACVKAQVSIPEEVKSFFQYEKPNENGVQVDIDDAVEIIHGEGGAHYRVDITKLPKDLQFVVFTNSW